MEGFKTIKKDEKKDEKKNRLRNRIHFAVPDIGEEEIQAVVDTLRCGWITTGKKVKALEEALSRYCGSEQTICLSSATAGLELTLRVLGIGEGDEVITTGYTYCATANAIVHTGAKVVFVDIDKQGFSISAELISEAINEKTKAVIVVDFGGWPVEYDSIKRVLEARKGLYKPKRDTWQECFDRVVLVADSAHSFGAVYNRKRLGTVADFTVFSFHSVKNLTTGEGGAVTFNGREGLSSSHLYQRFRLLSLHGQNKDAFAKSQLGSWEYSIELVGYKYNMTDIAASLGLVQLRRYEKDILAKRKQVVQRYLSHLRDHERILIPKLKDGDTESSYHLLALRVEGWDERLRNRFMEDMKEEGIQLNVHFIPVMVHKAYCKLGYSIMDYPNTYRMYRNEISFPVYSKLNLLEVDYICEKFKKYLKIYSRDEHSSV